MLPWRGGEKQGGNQIVYLVQIIKDRIWICELSTIKERPVHKRKTKIQEKEKDSHLILLARIHWSQIRKDNIKKSKQNKRIM